MEEYLKRRLVRAHKSTLFAILHVHSNSIVFKHPHLIFYETHCIRLGGRVVKVKGLVQELSSYTTAATAFEAVTFRHDHVSRRATDCRQGLSKNV